MILASALRWRMDIGVLRGLGLALLALLAAGSLTTNPARASAAMGAAAATAEGSVSGCGRNVGKALHNCVADVLDRLSSDISSDNVPETRRSLQNAASGLRAATTKAQALAAISLCRSAITAALRQVKALGGAYVRGWGGGQGGGSGLSAIAGVLAHASRLIQAKG